MEEHWKSAGEKWKTCKTQRPGSCLIETKYPSTYRLDPWICKEVSYLCRVKVKALQVLSEQIL
jgi:hypothetical protein